MMRETRRDRDEREQRGVDGVGIGKRRGRGERREGVCESRGWERETVEGGAGEREEEKENGGPVEGSESVCMKMAGRGRQVR